MGLTLFKYNFKLSEVALLVESTLWYYNYVHFHFITVGVSLEHMKRFEQSNLNLFNTSPLSL